MIHKNFSYALFFVNDGDDRNNAFFCQDFDSLLEAERAAKRSLREMFDSKKPDNRYIISLYNQSAADFSIELFTISYDGNDYHEILSKNL